jgi:OOP family OmpA-OmpF porin
MRIVFTAALLAASVAATAGHIEHKDVTGYWGNGTDNVIWHNSYGECWRTGTWTKEQAVAECEGGAPKKAEPAPAPVAAAAAPAAAPAPAPAPAPAAPVDTDGDGVTDDKDQCPNTKAGAKVDETGCKVKLKEKVTIKVDVKFATGGNAIDASGDAEVQKLADFLTEYPDTTVEVAGHTDNTGNAAFNRSLSQKRADAVRGRLIDKGIDGSRVTAKGYGPDQPVADNGTAEGRAANRRVEATVSQVVEKNAD